MRTKLFFLVLGLFILTGCSLTKDALQPMENNQDEADSKAPQNVGVTELTNNYVVEYDFKQGLYKKNNINPKVDNPVVYKISNINRYAYEIKVKLKDSVLAYSYSFNDLPEISKKEEPKQVDDEKNIPDTSPAKIEESDIANTEKIGKGDLVKIFNDILQAPAYSKQIITYEDEINELNKKIGSIINNIKDSLNNEVLLTIQKHDKIGKNIYESLPVKYEIQHYNSLLDDIALKQEAAKNLKKELQQIKNTESYLVQYTEDLEKLQRIFSNFRKTYKSLNKITQYNNFIFDVTNDPQINTIDKFNKHSKLKCDSIFNEIGALRKDVSDFKTLYYDFTLQYEKLKNNYKLNSVLKEAGTEKFYEYADGLKTRAENMNRNFDGNQLQKDLNAIYVAIKSMYDEDTYNWVSAPFVPTGDVVIFEVDLKKKEPTTKKIFNERKFVHREFTYGGTRIDFGLGLAASYFDNTPVYELSVEDSGVPAGGADSGNTSVIRIKRKSNELIVPSLVGMATMSYRSSHYITFGASAGLGIDVVNGKIQLSNFFAGPSVIFGRYERLVLTAGASFRNVGRLKSGYKENSIVSGNGSDIDSFISDRYKLGVFMALTFNLTKGIKQNIKSVKSML